MEETTIRLQAELLQNTHLLPMEGLTPVVADQRGLGPVVQAEVHWVQVIRV